MSLAKYDISIIVPKEATNLVTNPSFEAATTGYTASGAGVSIARSSTYQRRGLYSCEITTASGVTSGVYYAIALTSGTSYSFSADILDVAGQTFNLFIGDNATGALKSANVTWTGTGYWKRRSVTWTADSSTTFRLYITRSSVASTTKFYTDGWQLETGAVSTYFDGDLIGFVPGETAYRWNGTRHASTSWRSGQTRSGGTYVKIGDYFRILTLIGLGMGTLIHAAIPSTLGGSFFQNTIPGDRPFSIVVGTNAANDYGLINAKRSALINAVKPDLVTVKQPLVVQVDQLDANNLEVAETLQIPAVYEGGLELDGSQNAYSEKAALNFRSYLPLIRQDGEKGTALGYQTALSFNQTILTRTAGGTWSAMGSESGSIIYDVLVARDGKVYITGNFSNFGNANGDGIVYWNGTAWVPMGTGIAAGGYGRALAEGPDGSIYLAGYFSSVGGVANTVNIAKWDGAAWNALSTGITGAGIQVYDIAIDQAGNVYAVGTFVNITDANGDYISKFNGSAWSSLSTGLNSYGYSVAVGPDNSVYVGGEFTLAGGVSGTAYIAKWNGSAWSALAGGANTFVEGIAVGPDGSLYATGEFTTMGGVSASHIAKWNGAAWSPLGSGLNDVGYYLSIGKDNILYAAGIFTKAGGITLPSALAMWNGSSWMPLDVEINSVTMYHSLAMDAVGNLYVAFEGGGTTGASATVTVPNVGSGTAYPKIVFTGPGTCYQLKNYTTGKSIFFNLTLLAGETATLNLDPLNISFTSSFRGNILNAILPGSNLNWELLPGANNVSAYMYGSTTAATSIVMTWRDQYWSIDGAVR